jgi:cell division protein FtsX
MKIGTWLLSLLQPAIARILAALGMSVVSVVGMDMVFDQLKQQLLASFNALPAEMLAVFQLAGGGIALGIVFGAITTKVMLMMIFNSTKILGTNPG